MKAKRQNTHEPEAKAIVRALGGPVAVSQMLGISSQAVSQWEKEIPVKRVLELADHPDCKKTRAQLSPRVFGNRKRAASNRKSAA